MTVAHTTVLSRALDEGSFPSDCFLIISALDCIDTVYKVISSQYKYSFEGLRHLLEGQTDDDVQHCPEALPQVLTQEEVPLVLEPEIQSRLH